ncbi:hypothetical protein [Levilactobacillus andaensis]|uniref:hypothetical protein n=1 Tax=Levilactobacillus andaensis TaxID=2799570 RepID=UPI001F3BD4C0|nr:hypothetical protein [Levilactobacillus andaensis]
MIRRGYVVQSYQSSDRRVRPLSLTATGEQLETACYEALQTAAKTMSKVDLDDSGSQVTIGQLTKMLSAVTSKDETETTDK